jgi:predicted small secreted protein
MLKKKVIAVLILILALISVYLTGCETQGQTGALIGTGIGAGVGALAGRSAESTLIGGAVGGGAGYIVGNEADKKAQKQEMARMQQQQNSEIINIHNSNGSISQVRVTRSGTGYVGPRGEWYDHLPTEAELKPVYGF